MRCSCIPSDRLHVFGFLGGKEIKDAGIGNLGLQDRESCAFSENAGIDMTDNFFAERVALRWVNKFITAFGGDPSRVTM